MIAPVVFVIVVLSWVWAGAWILNQISVTDWFAFPLYMTIVALAIMTACLAAYYAEKWTSK